MSASTPSNARRRFSNFSRRFSRRSMQGSYFPEPADSTNAVQVNGAGPNGGPVSDNLKLSAHPQTDGSVVEDSGAQGTTRPQQHFANGGMAAPSNAPAHAVPAQRHLSNEGMIVPNTAHNTYEAPPNAPVTPENAPSASPASGSNVSPQYELRPPMAHRRFSSFQSTGKKFRLPDLPWLCGTWHVTHSTLPMWKNKRNVRIMYTRLPGNKLDDLVTYQNMDSKEIKSVHGIDTPKKDGAYLWRGKGLLKVASSKWEVLGWGGGGAHAAHEPIGTQTVTMQNPKEDDDEDPEQWVVTYFAKTPFTPAGIDVYSRRSTGLSPTTLDKLKLALARLDGRKSKSAKPLNDLGQLVDQIFPVMIDGARADLKE